MLVDDRPFRKRERRRKRLEALLRMLGFSYRWPKRPSFTSFHFILFHDDRCPIYVHHLDTGAWFLYVPTNMYFIISLFVRFPHLPHRAAYLFRVLRDWLASNDRE